MFIIQIFSFHIRHTRGCIVDIVVFIRSRWFMEAARDLLIIICGK